MSMTGGPGRGNELPAARTSCNSAAGGGGAQQMTPEQRDQMMKEMEDRMKEAEAKRRTVEYRLYYSDYQDVSGVKLPFKLQRSIDGKPAEEMTLEKIKVNQKIDPKKFEVRSRESRPGSTRLRRGFVDRVALFLLASPAFAQTSADPARLVVTVADQTGGVIPNAKVTVTAQDAAKPTAAIAPVTTAESGIATVERLAPGRYTIQAEFPGFETATVRDVRVGAGDNNRRTVDAADQEGRRGRHGRARQAVSGARSAGQRRSRPC